MRGHFKARSVSWPDGVKFTPSGQETDRAYSTVPGTCTGLIAALYKLACFVFSSLSGHAPPYLADNIHLVSEGHRRQLHSSTDRSCAVPRTTHTAGHVFGTVFRPTCVTRTLHTAVSGVNSKRFVLMLLPGRNETFVNCAI